jgi:hypothetical protein
MKISQTYLNKLISESIKKNIQQKISESYYDQNDVDDFFDEGPNIESELKRIEDDFNRTVLGKNGQDKSKTRRKFIINKFSQLKVPQNIRNIVHFSEDGTKMYIDRNAHPDVLASVVQMYDNALARYKEYVAKNKEKIANSKTSNEEDLKRQRKLDREKEREEDVPPTKQVVYENGMYVFNENEEPVMNEACPRMLVFKIEPTLKSIGSETIQKELKEIEDLVRGYSLMSSYSDEYERQTSGLINYKNHVTDPKTGKKIYTINQEYGYPIYRNNDTGEEIVPANIEDIKKYWANRKPTFDPKLSGYRKPKEELQEDKDIRPIPKYLDANGNPELNVPLNSYSDLTKYNDIAEFFAVYTEMNGESIRAIYIITDEAIIPAENYLRQFVTLIRYRNRAPETLRGQGNKGFRYVLRNLDTKSNDIFVRQIKSTPIEGLPEEFREDFIADWSDHYGDIAKEYNKEKRERIARKEKESRVNSGNLGAIDSYSTHSAFANYGGTVDEGKLAKMITESIKKHIRI